MNYLALGDSISIDDYTGQAGGGAASQFARLIGATRFENLTLNGLTTLGVMEALDEAEMNDPQIVTLTAGGNDLLQLAFESTRQTVQNHAFLAKQGAILILGNYESIAEELKDYNCPVIVNTIYDPTNGDDAIAAQMGVPIAWRDGFDAVNAGIVKIAADYGFLLCDLRALFSGHGAASADPWLVQLIEPNLAGATAIAKAWHELFARG